MKIIGAVVVSLAVAGCAAAAATVGFPAADANDDDVLSISEFHEFFDDTNAFERFDDDDNGNLSLKEYQEAVDSEYEGHFTHFDTDKNNNLSRAEFIGGWFGIFDVDKNGSLSKSEFEKSIESLEVEL